VEKNWLKWKLKKDNIRAKLPTRKERQEERRKGEWK